jgi:two-component system alkaline phosphatase synthesis response regulator PhoP
MKKILILSGNVDGAVELDSRFKGMGYDCFTAHTADGAIDIVKREAPNIVLVDADGLTASEWHSLNTEEVPKIKSAGPSPVIALMPQGSVDGIDSAFQIDDFVVRPFDFPELVARIKRILNRAGSHVGPDAITYGDLVLDTTKCEVTVSDRPIALTFKEYELLKFLIRHRGKVFTRDALLNEVWGYDYYGGDRTVDVHIRRLRSKIEDADHSFIDTVRNIGYKFCS